MTGRGGTALRTPASRRAAAAGHIREVPAADQAIRLTAGRDGRS